MKRNQVLSALMGFAWLMFTSATALISTSLHGEAQTACPDSSVRSTQVARYAYNLAERNLGGTPSCRRTVGIPADGIRVFSSWVDCRTGRFILVRESGGGAVPTSLSCPDCANTTRREAVLAPGTSSLVTAMFSFPDGATARYTATISRSVADPGNGSFVCSISGAQVAGGAFGGDITAPRVTLGPLSAVGDGTYSSAITLSEPAGNGTAFELADLTITNATATLSGSGTAFTATLTPQADGALTLAVAAGVFQDAAGNANTAAAEVRATYDGTAPRVEILGLPSNFAGTQSFSLTIAFSEPVTGFELADLVAANAQVLTLTGSGATYRVVVRAAGRGNVELSVPAGVAQDRSGNPNRASTMVSSANETVERTSDQIATFMASRANNLASNQPDLICALAGGCTGRMQVNATRGLLSFDMRSKPDVPIWFAFVGTRNRSGNAVEEYYHATLGSHHRLAPNALVGAMVQLDYQSSATGAQSVRGHGWLVGPYFVGKLPAQALYFEASALFGESTNTISPFGTYSDRFRTQRSLLQGKIAGELAFAALTLRPYLAARYTSDRQLAYRDSLGNVIPGQQVALGQVSAGLDFSKPVFVGSAEWMLSGGISLIHTETFTSRVSQRVQAPFDGTRGRVDFGISRQMGSGFLSIAGFRDGIGAQGYETLGLEVSLTMEF